MAKLLMVIKRRVDRNTSAEFWHIEIETLPYFEICTQPVVTTFLHGMYYPKRDVFTHIDYTKNQYSGNEYIQKYLYLIAANAKTAKEKYKTNCHHILPRCYFKLLNLPVDNSKTNLVNLSHKDHLLAHYYLYLCATGKFKLLNSLAFRYIETKYQLPIEEIIKNLDNYQQLCIDAKKQAGRAMLGK